MVSKIYETTFAANASYESNDLKIFYLVVGVFLTTCSVYVMTSLLVHLYETTKRAKRLRLKQIRELGSVRSRPRSHGTANLSAWLGRLSLAGSILAFFNCISDHALLYLSDGATDKICKIMQSFNFVFFPFGISCVYSFLWVRQRVFYSSPTLGRLRSKYLRWLSFAVLPVFFSLMISGMIATIAIYTFESSAVGCIETSGSKYPNILLYVGTLTMQTTLLILFVYPLEEHAIGEDALPENKMLLSLIKRASMTTIICVLADTTAFIIVMTLPPEAPFISVNLVRDGNLIVNVICIVCSFVDWKLRLASICYRKIFNKDEGGGDILLVRSSMGYDSRVVSKEGSQQHTPIVKDKSQKLRNDETPIL